MGPNVVPTPTSRLRMGVARCDITPPSDIYHRMWGAATHDRAEGVHRPLTATALVFEPIEAAAGDRMTLIALDHCIFRPAEMDEIHGATAKLLGIPLEQIVFTFSHTHSGGYHCRDRGGLPGGERIGPYLDSLPGKITAAATEAGAKVAPAVLTYGLTSCAMGHNRDYPDPSRGFYVCGFNPESPEGMPLGVVRIATEFGGDVATLVNYPCHPTTLAWENRLISPDYVGALRETVESQGGGPCLFLLAPCGDVGPRIGYVGDPAVADRNGRQVGLAAASVLASFPPAGHDFHYAGPVFSGATLGTWEHRPQDEERQSLTSLFRHQRLTIPLPYLSELPTLAEAQKELTEAAAREESLRAAGDQAAYRDAHALTERKRRLIERLRPLPGLGSSGDSGEPYPFQVDLWHLGDAHWIVVEGEPYHFLQSELQRRFPGVPLIFAVLANGARSSYLPERHDYGRPLYQAEVALLAPGSLERVVDVISAEIQTSLASYGAM